ncbi:hypothetical protein [uncultured Roseobacter sp.]|uniref:hypothetical protein n=1 Tax=uncultured Roseobacter sp. TaxID=114847 RepID=UPI00262FD9B5|nr:hypothetical protein [uncultured Roseobacter sp.]
MQPSRAPVELRDAIHGLFSGGDAFTKLFNTQQTLYETTHLSLQRRWLLHADEVMRMASGDMINMTDGLEGTIYAHHTAYFEDPNCAGLYLPTPYHPPIDKVQIATRFGQKWCPAVTKKNARELQTLPAICGRDMVLHREIAQMTATAQK